MNKYLLMPILIGFLVSFDACIAGGPSNERHLRTPRVKVIPNDRGIPADVFIQMANRRLAPRRRIATAGVAVTAGAVAYAAYNGCSIQ